LMPITVVLPPAEKSRNSYATGSVIAASSHLPE
jgi:hypothetical protein